MLLEPSDVQVLVPLAGRSPFFSAEQYLFPKPLLEVGGRLMIERVVENLSGIHRSASFIFVVHQQDVTRFSLDRTLALLTKGRCRVVGLSAPTQGALCSALMAIDQIDPDRPLVVANGDQVIETDLADVLQHFIKLNADAGVITFDSVHPRWSYVELDANGRVSQTAEKRVISRHAIAGFYYFKSGARFTTAAMNCIRNDVSVDGQFFIAPSLNEILLQGGWVAARHIPSSRFHSFYSPEKIRAFEDHVMKRTIEDAGDAQDAVRVLIPAAGEGSRFRAAGFAKPKPFVDLFGRPMIQSVIDNVVAPGWKAHMLLRKEHIVAEREEVAKLEAAGHVVHSVDALTEGTACTLLLARQVFDDTSPLLVANSDQYVDFSVAAYVADCMGRNLDGSILVFRDPTLNTKWSFARVNAEGLVQEVAEKKAISDLATVGIYLFRRGRDFVRGAIDMIVRNDRTNNEFYTCPVYNYMIRSGLRIGVFEVKPEDMHGLGTPEDLARYIEHKQ